MQIEGRGKRFHTAFLFFHMGWDLRYVPLQNECDPDMYSSADTLTDASDHFCRETQQPQVQIEGKILSTSYRGVRKANQCESVRTLSPWPWKRDMANTLTEREAVLRDPRKGSPRRQR